MKVLERFIRKKMDFKYTEKCNEISGFGGDYEETCRKMVIAGMEWFEANPKATPVFTEWKGMYGSLEEKNKDAKILTKAMSKASKNKHSGAMMHATVQHCRYANHWGWETYIQVMETGINPKE